MRISTPCLAARPRVEADDRGVRGRRELDVGLRDATDAAEHEADLDLGTLELLQALGERLEGALRIGLDDEVEAGLLARLDLGEDVLETSALDVDRGVLATCGLSLPALAGLGDRTSLALVRCHDEVVAGEGDVGQTEHLDRGRRRSFLDLLAVVVDEGADATPRRTGDQRVTDPERAVLHEDRGHRTPTDVEVRLDHDAAGAALGAGTQVLDLRDHEQVL